MPSDVIVDDSRLDLIRYIDPVPDPIGHWAYNWTHEIGPANSSSPFYNDSLSLCYQSGCLVMFLFHGTRIAVYGSEPIGTASWSYYSINGLSNDTHVTDTLATDRVLFYRSDEMPYGEYTLEIYVGHASDDSPYKLDWIEYNTTSEASDPSTSTASSSSTASATSPSSSTTHDTDTPVSTNHRTAIASPGAIAGGVVGGIVIIAFLVSVVGWSYRRRAARRRAPVQLDDERVEEHQDLINYSQFPTEPSPAYTPYYPSTEAHSGDPDVQPQMAEVQPSLVSPPLLPDSSESEDRRTPYGPHGVISGDEKATYLSLAGTTPANSSDHHEDGAI